MTSTVISCFDDDGVLERHPIPPSSQDMRDKEMAVRGITLAAIDDTTGAAVVMLSARQPMVAAAAAADVAGNSFSHRQWLLHQVQLGLFWTHQTGKSTFLPKHDAKVILHSLFLSDPSFH